MALSSRMQPHSWLAVARNEDLHVDAEKSKHFLCGLQMPHWFLTVTREYSEIGPTMTFKDKTQQQQTTPPDTTNYYRQELNKRV